MVVEGWAIDDANLGVAYLDARLRSSVSAKPNQQTFLALTYSQVCSHHRREGKTIGTCCWVLVQAVGVCVQGTKVPGVRGDSSAGNPSVWVSCRMVLWR